MNDAKTRSGEVHSLKYSDKSVSENHVLDLLNIAVWAPNDGLREPWRFIFMGPGSMDIMRGLQDQAPACLVLVVKEEHDLHKREEDVAATCCLMQNFRLLARENNLHVRMTMNDWIYDRTCAGRLGVQKDERIVAVLEMGYLEPTFEPVAAGNMPDLTFELL